MSEGTPQDDRAEVRWALVTGSTSGIGRATALGLAEDGYFVVVTGRDRSRAEAVYEQVQRRGGTAVPLIADLADAAAVRRLGQESLRVSGGRIAVLVNNAGGGTYATTEATTDDQIRESIAVQVHAPYVLTGLLAPIMAAYGAGSIVNVGSIGTTLAPAGLSLFHASKAALQSLTKSWTAEYGSRGVRVNTVNPGLIITPANEQFRDQYTAYLDTLPARRGATPDEVASVIRFLVSPAASYVQGASLDVDGGKSVVQTVF